MNSLAYLSRQFDVVASRTPPSTPTTDRHSYNPDRRRNTASESPLPRVQTWSTKSFLFSPQSRPGTPAKRSHSSPSDFITIAKQAAHSLPDESPPSTPELQVMPKDVDNLHSLLKRIFFVRVLSLAWDALQTAWMSLTGWYPVNGKVAVPVMVRDKEVTDDETTDESLPPSPLHLSSQQVPQPQSVHRSFTDPLVQGHKPPISPQDVPGSRASTPGAPPRRTPFHLPKTLVLDLDETLIHSTSRPMPSSSTGSGFFGLGALTRQKQGPGHVVEVVLGGRSTLYHVYKRPFVDFFLRTVRVAVSSRMLKLIPVSGLGMVHVGDIYGVDAGVRGSGDRLVRPRARDTHESVIQRCKSHVVSLIRVSHIDLVLYAAT